MANKKNQNAVISITGMHCKSCADKIESKLGSLDGVESIKVNLVENNGLVKFNPEKIKLETIKSEIAKLGYSTGSKNAKHKKGLVEGIMYGLIPHIGCIAFLIGSIFGVTFLMKFFKPLLLSRYFFHILILISLLFATASAFFYLRKNGFLSLAGIKRKWAYLTTMYGSTIGINLLLFLVIFPMLANVTVSSPVAGADTITGSVAGINSPSAGLASIQLKVDIPCPGHAPLISQELKAISGVSGIQFSFPDNFDVSYDPAKTSKQEILALEVFKTYPATVSGESSPQVNSPVLKPAAPLPAVSGTSSGGSCGGSGGGCGGSCGGGCGGCGAR